MTYVNPFRSAPSAASGLVTTTSAVAANRAGVVAVIWFELTITTSAAGAPPIVTEASALKLLPTIVTLVPPATGPVINNVAIIKTQQGLLS